MNKRPELPPFVEGEPCARCGRPLKLMSSGVLLHFSDDEYFDVGCHAASHGEDGPDDRLPGRWRAARKGSGVRDVAPWMR